jgi:hypothetical protein
MSKFLQAHNIKIVKLGKSSDYVLKLWKYPND